MRFILEKLGWGLLGMATALVIVKATGLSPRDHHLEEAIAVSDVMTQARAEGQTVQWAVTKLKARGVISEAGATDDDPGFVLPRVTNFLGQETWVYVDVSVDQEGRVLGSVLEKSLWWF